MLGRIVKNKRLRGKIYFWQIVYGSRSQIGYCHLGLPYQENCTVLLASLIPMS